MTQKVKVFNDNVHDFKSNFKGDPVFIKAKSYWTEKNGEPRVMDLYEANDFRGDYHPIMKGANEEADPKSYKMIRLEVVGVETAAVQAEHVCMQCKHKSPSPEELEAHIKVKHAEAVRTEIAELDEKPRNKARA
jgi:hypothetical protein